MRPAQAVAGVDASNSQQVTTALLAAFVLGGAIVMSIVHAAGSADGTPQAAHVASSGMPLSFQYVEALAGLPLPVAPEPQAAESPPPGPCRLWRPLARGLARRPRCVLRP
jgi:hypothetical protein